MPPIFKALASITVWVLFITGCLTILMALPIPYLDSGWNWQRMAVGIASLVLSVVVMKMRKTLE
jgi:hypothetical protein